MKIFLGLLASLLLATGTALAQVNPITGPTLAPPTPPPGYTPQNAAVPVAGPPNTPIRVHPGQGKYIYVTDRVQNQLLVYPTGVSNPSPIATVGLSYTPYAVATDKLGDVYVTLPAAGTVNEYSSGALNLINAISVPDPLGITVDRNSNIYVNSSMTQVQVYQYDELTAPVFTYFLPIPGSIVGGMAVDNSGDLFVEMISATGLGVNVVECPPFGTTVPCIVISNIVMLAPGGLGFDNQGNLVAGGSTDLAYYAPPLWGYVKHRVFPPGNPIRYMSSGPDGTLFIPFDESQPPAVMVIPVSGDIPFSITQGLQAPYGAAVGN